MVERRRSRRSTPNRFPHRWMRTCAGCRRRADRSLLLRVAAVVEDDSWNAVPNERGRYPGRGAWLHPNAECFENAVRRRGLHRAFSVPPGGELNVKALRERCTGPAGSA